MEYDILFAALLLEWDGWRRAIDAVGRDEHVRNNLTGAQYHTLICDALAAIARFEIRMQMSASMLLLSLRDMGQ